MMLRYRGNAAAVTGTWVVTSMQLLSDGRYKIRSRL